MVRGILSRLSYSNVIATIALFAALSGGYAVAFSGSGTLQKAAVSDLGSNYQTVRTLTGIGSIQAKCAGDDVVLRVHSDEKSFAFGIQSESGTVTGPGGVDGGTDSAAIDGTADPEFIQLYIYRGGANKRPQADVQIGTRDGEISCAGTQVSVLALNTEE